MDHDVRRLRAFVTVAEVRHFRRAATRLSVSPSVLTQQISRLEADLGYRLLDRTTRQVDLTDEGRAFLPLAQDVVAANARLLTLERPDPAPPTEHRHRPATSAKRDDILWAAVKLFALKGVPQTRWGDIAAAVNTPLTTLYYYFDSKHHCLYEIQLDATWTDRARFKRAVRDHADFSDALVAALAALYDLTQSE